MICNKIQVLEYPSGIPSDYFTDGVLFLDPDDDFGIRQTRRAEELNEVQKINTSAALPIDLPYTTKNFIVLGKFINPNVHNFDFKPLRVIAYSSSNVITPSLLYVLSHDEKNRRFVCELRDDESHWLVGSKKLKLNDIQFPLFNFTKTNVEGTWPLNSYSDGDSGLYFFLAFYGAWKENGFASLEDFRPWYSVYYLLKKGFAKIGWVFKSPLFDVHPIGKKLFAYLLEPFSLSKQQKEGAGTFSATITTEKTFNSKSVETVIFDFEEYDENNVYNNTTGIFSETGYFDIFFYLYFKIAKANLDSFQHGILINIIKENNGVRTTLKLLVYGTFTIDPTGHTDSYVIKGNLPRVSLSAADKVSIELHTPGYGEILTGGGFYNRNLKYSIKEFDLLNPSLLIANDYRLYDIILGVAHLFRIKFHTDQNRKEVTFFPNYKTKWYDTQVDGYYLDETINLKDISELNSSIVTSQAQNLKRYIRLQFKESTDARIQGLNYPKDKPPFSKTYDLGEHFENDIDVNDNPFFEPTVNDKVFSIRPQFVNSSNEYYIDLPFLVDNDSDLPSFNIGPRILIAHGYQEYEGFDGQSMSWQWYDQYMTSVPYGSQIPNYRLPGGIEIKESLVYGDHKDDLFSRFWKRWIYDNLINLKVNILAYLLPKDFHSYNFRKVYHVLSNGKSVFGRIIAINDFDGCGNTLTGIDLIPSTGNVKAPTLEVRSVDEFCAGQNPVLSVAKSGSTYTATADLSQVTDTVNSSVIEWRYFDVSTWTAGSVVTNPTKPFYFRLRVTLATCGIITRLKYVNPCSNQPVLIWKNVHRDPLDMDKWCITADIDGILNDPILTTDFEVSIDGATPIPYTINTEVCGIESDPTEIDIRVLGSVQFDNDCDAIPLEAEYNFPPTNINCADNKPTVICVHEGNGMFTFLKSGTWASKLSVYFIQYRKPGDTDDDWITWDHEDPAPVPGTVEIRGIFFWCDACEKVCTPPVTCMEPMSMVPSFSFKSTDDMAANYDWQWNKLDEEEKQDVKNWYKSGKWQKIALLHNRKHLSDYEFCCGDDNKKVFAHVKAAIDNGQI